VVLELSSACDLVGVRIPRRQVNARTCTWLYKGAECGYVPGPMFDANDNPVTDPLQDVCSQKLTGCKARFYGKAGTKRAVALPFGAFPGAGTGGTQ
jgi:lambda family phage minor tail protein L